MRVILEAVQTILFYVMAAFMIASCVALYNGMEFAWTCVKVWMVTAFVIGCFRTMEVIFYE